MAVSIACVAFSTTAKAELDAVRKQYENTPQWMKAPNGEDTNLSERQWLQVRTPSFKQWFGDWEKDRDSSVVTDNNDEPLVVRHFTNDNFDTFDISKSDGFWFTDKADIDDDVGANGSGRVVEAFLNIRDPDYNSSNSDVEEYLGGIEEDGIINIYDGFTDYAVINPEQIKSATGNIGAFDNDNNDIRYSRQSMQDTIDKLSQNLKQFSVKSIKDKTGYKWADWLGVGLQFLGRRQLTEIYAKLLPQLSKYNELAAQMDADKNDAGAKADSIVTGKQIGRAHV